MCIYHCCFFIVQIYTISKAFLYHIFLAFCSSLQHCDEAVLKECNSGFSECDLDGLIILSKVVVVRLFE